MIDETTASMLNGDIIEGIKDAMTIKPNRAQRRMTAKKARKQGNKHYESYSRNGKPSRQVAFGYIGACGVYTDAKQARDLKRTDKLKEWGVLNV